MAYIIIARNLLLHYGAVVVPSLESLWPSLKALMDYLDRQVDPQTGLLLSGARGDWIPPEGNGKGPFPTGTAIVAAFFHSLCLSHMAEIGAAVGQTEAAKQYQSRFTANQAAFHAHFYNGKDQDSTSETGEDVFGARCCYDKGSQTANVFALHLGAVPSAQLNATLGMLVTSIYNRQARHPGDHTGTRDRLEQRSWLSRDNGVPPAWGSGAHMDCGIFGTTYLFEVLHAHGADRAGWDILNETSYPR